MTFNLDPLNFETSYNNLYFYSTLAGTTNMTTTYNAPIFVSNGNFYGVDSVAGSALPTDVNGNPFMSDQASGDSYFVIEELSGRTM